jgi:hypothetical protein
VTPCFDVVQPELAGFRAGKEMSPADRQGQDPAAVARRVGEPVNKLAGRLYAVDRNDALVPNPQVWTEFTNNIAGTGGALIINDPFPGTNRSYRVRVRLGP